MDKRASLDGHEAAKKQKDFLAKVRSIPDSFKEVFLAHYIEKYKHQNAIHFFEWHKKYIHKKTDWAECSRIAKERTEKDAKLIN